MALYTSEQLLNRRIPLLKLNQYWKNIFGSVPAEEQWIALLSGPPSAGKSTHALNTGRMLSKFDRVLYVPAEEHLFTGTLQTKLRLAGRPKEIDFLNVRTWSEIVPHLKNYRYVIIDSISALAPKREHSIIREQKNYPHISFLNIIQSKKDRAEYIGTGELLHDVDIYWWIESAPGNHDQTERRLENRKFRFEPAEFQILKNSKRARKKKSRGRSSSYAATLEVRRRNEH